MRPVAKPPSARRQSHGLHRLIASFVHACAVVRAIADSEDRVNSDQRDAVARAEFLRAGEFTAAPVKTMRRSGLRSVPALPQSGFNASPPASRQVHAQVRACLSPLEEVDNALSAVGAGVEPNHPIHRIPLEKMVEAIRISKERDKRLEAAIEEPACDGADCRLPFRSQSLLSAGASEFLQPPGRLPHPPIPRNRHASEPL